MANCSYTIDGKTYSKSELKAWLYDGGLEQLYPEGMPGVDGKSVKDSYEQKEADRYAKERYNMLTQGLSEKDVTAYWKNQEKIFRDRAKVLRDKAKLLKKRGDKIGALKAEWDYKDALLEANENKQRAIEPKQDVKASSTVAAKSNKLDSSKNSIKTSIENALKIDSEYYKGATYDEAKALYDAYKDNAAPITPGRLRQEFTTAQQKALGIDGDTNESDVKSVFLKVESRNGGQPKIYLTDKGWNFIKSIISKPSVKFSKSQSTTGSTIAQVTSWLPKRVGKMLEAGKLVVVQSVNDLPANLRQAGNALFHTVFHGTPYDFDRFSLDRIGTGEGAQAFGYGLYFTDKQEIAEYYRDKLSKGDVLEQVGDSRYIRLKGRWRNNDAAEWASPDVDLALDLIYYYSSDKNKAIKEAKLAIENEKEISGKTTIDSEDIHIGQNFYTEQEVLSAIRILETSYKGKTKEGKLYQVELAPTQDEYLDWDKPLSEQSEKVKDALGNWAKNDERDWSSTAGFVNKTMTGEQLYKSASSFREAKDISDAMHKAGIRGIRYKAEGGKSDASNYVVFSEEDISITAKYSQLSGIEALYDSKSDTVYLVADMLNKGNLSAVLSHELLHRGLATDSKLKDAYDRFQSDMQRRFSNAAKGIGTKADKDAYARVMDAKTPEKDRIEEFGAYMVSAWQQNPDSVSGAIKKAIQDFIAAIRAFLIRNGLDRGFIKSLTPADLMAMSRYGAKAGKADSQGGIKASTKTLPEKITIDGVERWTVNSDGKPIAQDEAGIRNFWKWFGDSKVVDGQGRPLVVYHGTNKDFTEFSANPNSRSTTANNAKNAIFFTDNHYNANYFSTGDVAPEVREFLNKYVKMYKKANTAEKLQDAEKFYADNVEKYTDETNTKATIKINSKLSQYSARVVPVYLKIEKYTSHDFEGKQSALVYARKINEARENTDGAILKNVEDPRKGNVYVVFDPTQIKSAIGNTGAFDSTNPDIRYSIASKATDLLKDKQSKFDTAIYQLQDRYVDLKRQMEKVVRNGGKITANPYQAEELYHQRAASRIKEFNEKELTPILQGLHDNGISMDDFQKFLHARHAESRNAVMAERNPSQAVIDAKLAEAEAALDALDGSDKKAMREAQKEVRKWRKAKPFNGTEEERLSLSGMSNQDARDFMSKLPADKAKAMTTLGDKIDRITNKTLDLLVSYGMETQETVDALKAQWEHYVPLHRDEAHPDNNGQPIGKGFSVRGSGLKTATGSNAEVTNILAHLAAQREQMIRRGEKNRVSNILADFIKLHPDDEFATVDKVEMQDSLNDDGLVESRMEPFFKRSMKDNVIMFRKDGKDHAITFNDRREDTLRLAMSLKNMDAGLDAVESVFAKGTRWMASINTQYNIVFGLFNLLRDTQGMMLNMTTTPLAGRQKQVFSHLWDSMKIIYQSEQGLKNMDPTLKAQYDAFNKAGGTTGYSQMFDDIRSRNKSLEEQLKDMSAGKGKKLWNAAKQWVTDYNTVMENATRLSVFIEAKNQGLSDDEAASIAKNITVNFNRKGSYTTKVGALYAFFNASTQGTARLLETMKGPKGKQIMAGGVLAGAVSTILGMMVMGDDEWEKIPEFERERNLIIPTSKTGYAKIAMPLGFHILPNIGRKVIEMMAGSSKVSPQQRLFELAAATAGAFNPLGSGDPLQLVMPTVADPLVDLARNKDWTGKTIYREDLNSLNPTPGFTRTKDTATSFSKGAAYAINKLTGGTEAKQGFWSPTPDEIDYLLGQITGGTGREISKAWQASESVFTGEELPAYKRPLIGRLYGETKGNAAEKSAYYDNVKRLNEHEAEIKWLRENKQAAKVSEYLRENPEAKLVLKANGIENAIKKLKSTRSKLEGMGVGKERLTAIDTQIVAHMKRLNDAVSSVND